MFACVDVAYEGSSAHAACLLFRSWTDASAVEQITVTTSVAGEYRPGEFFRRELPAILAVLERTAATPVAIVIDGYVWLGGARPGLGARLYDALGQGSAIVGVAKTAWGEPGPTDGPQRAICVVRGRSTRPLFVTAAGIDVAVAATHVRNMHGPHRMPSLLKAVDGLARGRLLRFNDGKDDS